MLNKVTSLYAAACDKAQFPGEGNDCVPRALSLAANRPYAEVHALCAAHGRKYGKGTSGAIVMQAARDLGGTYIQLRSGYSGYMRPQDGPTLAQFIRQHPGGRFYINKRGHGFALIDGVVHDWNSTSGPRTKVTLAFRFDNP